MNDFEPFLVVISGQVPSIKQVRSRGHYVMGSRMVMWFSSNLRLHGSSGTVKKHEQSIQLMEDILKSWQPDYLVLMKSPGLDPYEV